MLVSLFWSSACFEPWECLGIVAGGGARVAPARLGLTQLSPAWVKTRRKQFRFASKMNCSNAQKTADEWFGPYGFSRPCLFRLGSLCQTDAFWKVCMVSVFTPNKIEHNFVKVVRMNSSVFPANGIFHGAQLQPFSLLQFLPRSKLHWTCPTNHVPICSYDSWLITMIHDHNSWPWHMGHDAWTWYDP